MPSDTDSARGDQTLLSWFQTGEPRVGVIGLGYVGLPLCLAFARAGLPVTGFDIDRSKISILKRGDSYLSTVSPTQVRPAVTDGRFTPSTDFSLLSDCNAVLLCVPTPLGKSREPDLSFVEQTCCTVAEFLEEGQLIVLESTTYPGTTDEVVRPILETTGLKAGEDFWLAFSPEREDPGNPDFTTSQIAKLVGGLDSAAGDLAQALYQRAFHNVVRVSSAAVAEAAKLLENIYRSVNIALVNELKLVFEGMDIDIWEVIAAARTKPFGFQAFYPGPGLGGHCIPIDPFYLTWKAAQYGVNTRFIELAGEINSAMPHHVVHRVQDVLNDHGKPLRGSRVLLLGVAYKPGVSDTRESPGLELIDLLQERGAKVLYHDPLVPHVGPTRKYDFDHESVALSPELLATIDCVLLSVAQPEMDLALVAQHARVIVDTRNAFAAFPDAKVVKA